MAAVEAVPSPCILVCTLEDGVCLGCGRTIGEIGEWSAATLDRQREIVKAAAARRDERRPPRPTS